jgi:tRNA (mo5U34)-methyltransferase
MSVLIRNPVLTTEETQALVDSVCWFHRIEVVPGVITPGRVPSDGVYGAGAYIDSLNLGDLQDKRVLELGTWDGPLAFELAQRGVDVVASDIQYADKTGFNVLKKISGIEIPYIQCSAYELGRHFQDEFDVILFFGVFYHLKHPFLAFSHCAKALKMGGILLTEGEGMGHHLEDVNGHPVSLPDSVIPMLDQLDELGVPMALSYPGTYMRGENWVLPNRSCLKGWMINAGLEAEPVYTQKNPTSRRIGTRGRKVVATEKIEHSLTGVEGGYVNPVTA